MRLLLIFIFALCSLDMANAQDSNLQNFRRVYIGGYANEVFRDHYFKSNIAAELALGTIPNSNPENVHVIFPSSLESISSNIEKVASELRAYHAQDPSRPLIVMGHSMGGAILMGIVIKYPELVLNNAIAHAFPTQAILRAGFMPDFLTKYWPIFPFYNPLNPLTVNPNFFFMRSLLSMRTSELKKTIHDPLAELPSHIRNELSKHVSYIVSSVDAEGENVSTSLKVSAKIIQNKAPDAQKANDGLIPEIDQSLSGFGRVAIRLKDVDHVGFTIGKAPSDREPISRVYEQALVVAKKQTEYLGKRGYGTPYLLPQLSCQAIF